MLSCRMSSTQIGNLHGGDSGTVTLPKDGLREDGLVDPETDEVQTAAVRTERTDENTFEVEILDV